MPRKRTTVVTESPARLIEFERQVSGSSRLRLMALRMIQERPDQPLGDIARTLGVSTAALGRWWAEYRRGGLDALLATKQRGGYRPSRVDDLVIETIRTKREEGELRTRQDVQQWLLREHGLVMSRSGVGYLLKTHCGEGGRHYRSLRTLTTQSQIASIPVENRSSIKAQGSGVTVPSIELDEGRTPKPSGQNGGHRITVDQLIRLINTLPLQHDTVAWIQEFKQILGPLLPDVSRISITVNTECDLLNPDDYNPDIAFTHSPGSQSTEGDVLVTAAGKRGKYVESVIAGYAEQGAPLEQFQTPIWREYYYEGTAYLGVLILWRDIGCKPISESTIRFVDQLEPFIVFMLSDLVARHDYANPLDRAFHDVLQNVSIECGLSFQERRVLGLRLLGDSYKSIASQFGISQNSVRKHLTSVHHKTGTHSSVQLFAKYFTPRLAGVSNHLR